MYSQRERERKKKNEREKKGGKEREREREERESERPLLITERVWNLEGAFESMRARHLGINTSAIHTNFTPPKAERSTIQRALSDLPVSAWGCRVGILLQPGIEPLLWARFEPRPKKQGRFSAGKGSRQSGIARESCLVATADGARVIGLEGPVVRPGVFGGVERVVAVSHALRHH